MNIKIVGRSLEAFTKHQCQINQTESQSKCEISKFGVKSVATPKFYQKVQTDENPMQNKEDLVFIDSEKISIHPACEEVWKPPPSHI